MALIFTPLDEAAARRMLTWRYPPPYEQYNLGEGDTAETLHYLIDPVNRFYAVSEDTGDMIGFCSFGTDAQVAGGDYSDDQALDIGIGLRPTLTGRGLGLPVVQAILAFARQQWGTRRFRLTVAAHNTRAIRVYERAGFRQTRRFLSMGGAQQRFIQMVREDDEPA